MADEGTLDTTKPATDSSDEEDVAVSKEEDGQSMSDQMDKAEKSKYDDIESASSTPSRDHWAGKTDFVLSCVGFAVGLGNVWRFPYLCYKNGGGAFFIPYLICLVTGGVPVFFLEIAIGQFMSQGGLGVWKMCPIFQGIGVATTVICFLLNIYYIVVLAWDLYYCAMAFTSVLPWSHCNNTWNTYKCQVSFGQPDCVNATELDELISNITDGGSLNSSLWNITLPPICEFKNYTPVDPVVEFWENKILQISDGVDQPDGLVWQLAVSLLIAWVVTYFCIWRGVKWTGKVVWFTATFPYVVLTILLVRGVTLDGAADGLVFYLKPDFARLSDAQVWIDAGTQIFFSYAIGLGAMIALGSYNDFHNDSYRQTIFIVVVNSFTSIYAGFVIFSVLGFMAKEQQVPIQDVAESGPGLAFIAYPKAVTQMPVAPLWAILFFFMIVLLGLDSQFVGVEAFVTVIVDLFPTLRRHWYREIFIAGYCLVSYLIGLTMMTRGGMYVFQLFDYYSASGMALLWVCFFTSVAVAWVYGANRFYDNIQMMIGYRINPWLKICWTFLTPVVSAGIFIFMWVQFEPLTYNRTYVYPAWAQGLGMCLAFASMICIPAVFIIRLLMTRGTLRERWRAATTPKLQSYQVPDHWPDAHLLLKNSAAPLSAKEQQTELEPFIINSNGQYGSNPRPATFCDLPSPQDNISRKC